MPSTIDQILERIQETQKKGKDNEAAAVKVAIELGQLFRELKAKAPRVWGRKLKQLGYHDRVASRYLKIGESWSTPDRTPGSDLLAKLPSDVHQLEWLCRLPVDELKRVCQQIDCRKQGRAQVINAVKGQLGMETTPKQNVVSLESVRKKWDAHIDSLLKDLEELPDEERQQLVLAVMASLAELQQTLRSTVEDQALPDEDDTEEADEADKAEEEADEEADKAAKTPVGRRRSRPGQTTSARG